LFVADTALLMPGLLAIATTPAASVARFVSAADSQTDQARTTSIKSISERNHFRKILQHAPLLTNRSRRNKSENSGVLTMDCVRRLTLPATNLTISSLSPDCSLRPANSDGATASPLCSTTTLRGKRFARPKIPPANTAVSLRRVSRWRRSGSWQQLLLTLLQGHPFGRPVDLHHHGGVLDLPATGSRTVLFRSLICFWSPTVKAAPLMTAWRSLPRVIG